MELPPRRSGDDGNITDDVLDDTGAVEEEVRRDLGVRSRAVVQPPGSPVIPVGTRK